MKNQELKYNCYICKKLLFTTRKINIKSSFISPICMVCHNRLREYRLCDIIDTMRYK